jgi:hypothetical protein
MLSLRSLELDDISANRHLGLDLSLDEDNLTDKMREQKLHEFLVIIVFTYCTLEAARTLLLNC